MSWARCPGVLGESALLVRGRRADLIDVDDE